MPSGPEIFGAVAVWLSTDSQYVMIYTKRWRGQTRIGSEMRRKLRLRDLQSDLHLGQMDQSEVQNVHFRHAEKHQMKFYIRSWIQ
jgi:hypothetical protein